MPDFRKEVEKLQDQIGDAIQENRSFLETAQKEERDLSAEEQQTYDQNDEKITDLIATKKRYERQIDRDEWVEGTQDRSHLRPDPEDQGTEAATEEEQRQQQYAGAYRSYLRYGREGLTPDEKQIMGQRYKDIDPKELRALSTQIGTAGGYLIPEGSYGTIIDAMTAWGGMRQARTEVIQTQSGEDIPIPTGDDTANKGRRIQENKQISSKDITMGVKPLRAYWYTSDIIRVPIPLLQDEAYNLEGYINGKLSMRLGRIMNEEDTTGTGNSMPLGIDDAATVGKTAASETAVTVAELKNLFYSVDPAYRANAEWMFNDTTLQEISNLKGTDVYFFQPDLARAPAPTILGKPYVINQDMPDMATGNNSILFGDFSYYKIRDVRQIILMRLVERYADYGQVGFLAFARHDGTYANPGNNPIKALQQA